LAANSVGMSVDTLPRNGLIIVDEVGLAHSTRSSSDLFRVVAAAGPAVMLARGFCAPGPGSHSAVLRLKTQIRQPCGLSDRTSPSRAS
jgi:hypothetical protein